MTNLSFDLTHEKSGVILVNLGSPANPEPRAIKRFIRELLSDPRVIELPRWIWLPILELFILPRRSKVVAKLYQKIWFEEGSPLIVYSNKLVKKLSAKLSAKLNCETPVAVGMRYGTPSIRQALKTLEDNGCKEIVIIPLYPQYSASCTGSSFDAIAQIYATQRVIPEIHWVNSFYAHPGYINALAESIAHHWKEQGRADKLLISFHGLPLKYIQSGDPYFNQCHQTASLLANRLSLNQSDYTVSFQSRYGPTEWTKPYTVDTLQNLPKEGITSIDVICPGFCSDCLETLEEIATEGRKIFIESGGKEFRYIPCLNDLDEFVDCLTDLIISSKEDRHALARSSASTGLSPAPHRR